MSCTSCHIIQFKRMSGRRPVKKHPVLAVSRVEVYKMAKIRFLQISETDFTQEKGNFHPTTYLNSPIPPLTAAALRMIICKRPAPPDDHLQEAGPSGSSFARGRPLILTTTKRAWKMHFWDPSQWDKMCFECQRIKFQWKKDQNFYICLRSVVIIHVSYREVVKKMDNGQGRGG